MASTERPLLYVCVRPQQEAASAEYRSFRDACRLNEAELRRHDLVAEPLPLDIFDQYAGFVIGGSPYNVTDPEATKVDAQLQVESGLERIARTAADGKTTALFTCFGIGVVTRLLGGEVTRGFPENTGPAVITRTPQSDADPLFGPLARRFQALTAHKEGAAALPPGAVLLATNDECPVQAYRVGSTLYATQFHPEPTAKAFTERMAIYRNDGYFEADAYDAVAARVLSSSLTEPSRLLRAFAHRARTTNSTGTSTGTTSTL